MEISELESKLDKMGRSVRCIDPRNRPGHPPDYVCRFESGVEVMTCSYSYKAALVWALLLVEPVCPAPLALDAPPESCEHGNLRGKCPVGQIGASMNHCKNCFFWKSDKLDPSPVAGKCAKLETVTGNLFGCVHWQSAQQNEEPTVESGRTCPVCGGNGKVANTRGVLQFCIPCDGRGQT